MPTKLQHINTADVRVAYKRWAPVYDATFGKLVTGGVKETVALANRFSGRLLEAGVGTGLALPHYGSQLKVTGVDLSADMLKRARERVTKLKRQNIEALLEMDATQLEFPDGYFDVSVAMHVLTVVPDPARVMHELARVTKPGGTIIVVNHFSVTSGLRGAIEKSMAKHSRKLGWRPEFPIDTVLACDRMRLVSLRVVKPMGFFTLLEFRRLEDPRLLVG